MFGINWTTVISSAITSVINAMAVFLSIRYMGKIVDKFERTGKKIIKEDTNREKR